MVLNRRIGPANWNKNVEFVRIFQWIYESKVFVDLIYNWKNMSVIWVGKPSVLVAIITNFSHNPKTMSSPPSIGIYSTKKQKQKRNNAFVWHWLTTIYENETLVHWKILTDFIINIRLSIILLASNGLEELKKTSNAPTISRRTSSILSVEFISGMVAPKHLRLWSNLFACRTKQQKKYLRVLEIS